MYRQASAFLLTSILTTNCVIAATDPSEGLWKGSAELGFISTSGNTETESIKAKGVISTERNSWRHNYELSALNSSDQVNTTAERYIFIGQIDYKLSKTNYFLAVINYEDDRFSGYQYRLTESLGFGYRAIDKDKLKIDVEIGPGARQSKLDAGDNQNEAIARAAAKIDWAISDTTKLNQVLTVDYGEDSTITKSSTGLTSKIAGSLAMKFDYTIKNTSDVPPGIKKTDAETTVTLVYSF